MVRVRLRLSLAAFAALAMPITAAAAQDPAPVAASATADAGFTSSPEHKAAVTASRPYMTCVLAKAKTLGASDADDAQVTAAAKAACQAELAAYAHWFDGKTYSTAQKGLELTVVQRTMDKMAPKAAAMGRGGAAQ